MVALETIVVRKDGMLDAEVGDETVLMSVESGEYYALKETSRAIWDRLKVPVRVDALCDDLATAYRMPLERVTADTLDFLRHLETLKMIQIHSDQDHS